VAILRMIVGDPAAKRTDQGAGAAPLLQPEAFLCDLTPHPRGIGLTLGGVVAGKGLLAPQEPASCHEGPRGRLTPMVTQQGDVRAPSTMRKLALPRHVPSRQPRPSGAGCPSVVSHDLLGLPIAPEHDLDPAATLHQPLGQVDAPPRVQWGRPRCAAGRRPFGLSSSIRRAQPLLCSPEAQHARLGDRALRDITPVGPAPAVPPQRGLGCKRSDAWPPRVVRLTDVESPLAPQPPSSSRFVSASVRSPTSVFSRAFSWARRASGRPCCGPAKA
jgi:hypothetical protein